MTEPRGTLWLIPCPIAEEALTTIPEDTRQRMAPITCFLAEELRTARRYLSSLKIFPSIEALRMEVLDKKTKAHELPGLLRPLHEGKDVGVLSESGCPGVADPGALAVAYAHQHGFGVVPLVGPSSLLLALMASGLNGQRFAFHGYLPIDAQDAAKAIRALEAESRAKQQTQLFIETPYRNNTVFSFLLKNLNPDTWLHVSLNLTGQSQQSKTWRVREWRAQPVEWPKQPAVYAFLAS